MGKNCNGQFTTERIGRLHEADQTAWNDHERSDADQNLGGTRAISDDAIAVVNIFSGVDPAASSRRSAQDDYCSLD